MKSIDFLNKFTDPKIPAIARDLVQQAVEELNNGNEKPLQVTELEFNLIVRYAGIKPNKTGNNLWFRIYDQHQNSKDVQVYNAWSK